MTAEIVNLRQRRKAGMRAEKARAAEENRRRHGMTKAERTLREETNRLAARHLDGAKRDVSTDAAQRPAAADTTDVVSTFQIASMISAGSKSSTRDE